MKNEPLKILIVGGGITGLSAAWYAQKQASTLNRPVHITLAEKTEHFGGKIQTEVHDDFIMEKGPDSFLARKTIILELIRELGLEDELVGTNPHARKNYILHRNRLHLMPAGSVLGIPTKVKPFLQTGLLSPMGKWRAAADFLLPFREQKDLSLGAFLERRLGREVTKNITEPLLSGIYAGNAHDLSLDATFPQFRTLVREHGSLIRGMIHTRQERNRNTATDPLLQHLPEELKDSAFLTLRHGLSYLIDTLVSTLEQNGVRLHQQLGVTTVEKAENDSSHIRFDTGETAAFDRVVLTAPVHHTARMLPEKPPFNNLKAIPYVSVANVVMAFPKSRRMSGWDASGFVIPRNEGKTITACTWTSVKWPHTSPDDQVLIRCYVGHSKDQSIVEQSDEAILAAVRTDLKTITGLDETPAFYRVTRWKQAMPQYGTGHLDRLRHIREALAQERPGVILAGAGYEGVGIPDCVRQGKEAALQVLKTP